MPLCALDGLSGQPHAPAVLSPWGTPSPPLVQTDTRLYGPQSRSGRFGDETNVVPQPAIEPRFLGRKIHVIVSIPTELSWFKLDTCFKELSCATCNLGPTPTFRPLVLGIFIFLQRVFQIVLAVATSEHQTTLLNLKHLLSLQVPQWMERTLV